MERLLREQLTDGKFNSVTPARSKMMKAVRGKNNKSTELIFRQALLQAKIFGWKIHENIAGNPDIYFPAYKIAIFLDGCFWHGCLECGHIPKTNNAYWKTKICRTIERDHQKSEVLKDQGYLVIRFWEHELSQDIQNVLVC